MNQKKIIISPTFKSLREVDKIHKIRSLVKAGLVSQFCDWDHFIYISAVTQTHKIM